ncbi:DUF2059 domain-containing protein [Janthinobacterium sp.]|uniref:DUF2059 domain-containing protein n=1 Tax=Janthinobacterium sp. TaxID=1871054 RepID=UPI002614D0B5|nr:DUF2059 domain-containing protein [Janthinobacterium sp.]
MKKLFAVSLASIALLFAAPAWANDEVSPEMKVAVEQLLDTMQFNDMARKTMGQMMQVMPAILRQSALQTAKAGRKLSAEDEAQVSELLEKFIPEASAAIGQVVTDPALIAEMRTEMAPLYARYYTVQEVRGLAAFYASPLGQKMVSITPELTADSMAISQRVLMPRTNAVIQKIVQKILASQ